MLCSQVWETSENEEGGVGFRRRKVANSANVATAVCQSLSRCGNDGFIVISSMEPSFMCNIMPLTLESFGIMMHEIRSSKSNAAYFNRFRVTESLIF